jgi:ribosomal protein L12E/L44/L45/RPP1/RPP2
MKQDLGFLPLLSAKMAYALLASCEEKSLSDGAEEYALDALRYYNSEWKWLPEPLPGLGHIDGFLYLLSAMWVCQEADFPKLTSADLELLPKRINSFFKKAYQERLEAQLAAAEAEAAAAAAALAAAEAATKAEEQRAAASSIEAKEAEERAKTARERQEARQVSYQ